MSAEVEKIIAALYRNGIQDLVLCPGSRNAPLLIAVSASGWFNLHSVPDERTAGFTALGMARTLQQPVGVVCTSGSALINLYPAVVEAYYQQVPLVVISADRPPEWIDQMDGQTIRQQGVMEQHLRASFYLDTPPYHDLSQLDFTAMPVSGPVHINLPFREPFYPEAGYTFQTEMPELAATAPFREYDAALPEAFLKDYSEAQRVMVLAGSLHSDDRILRAFRKLASRADWLVLAETDSGLATASNVAYWEQLLKGETPDLLITLGYSFLSKPLKQWLRNAENLKHWFVSHNNVTADTFRHFSGSIRQELFTALQQLEQLFPKPVEWASGIKAQGQAALQPVQRWMEQEPFSEPIAVAMLLQALEPYSRLEVANSMPIRWVQALQPLLPYGIEVKANRGTSGIDGCVSTAAGVQKASEEEVYLLCGDLAFFYDSNAFWQQPAVGALKVIILNNQGGRIFELINGPGQHPGYLDRFVTPHKRSAEWICKDHGIAYTRANDRFSLEKSLEWLRNREGAAVLEVTCDPALTAASWRAFKAIFH